MKKIDEYVDSILENAPRGKKTNELKEELKADLTEKYNDLITEGKKENDAYQEVIASIGNIDELINSHKIDDDINDNRKKNALVVSICVGLYIVALLACIVIDEYVEGELSAIVFLGICGISTCILIYHNLSKPKYSRQDDTMIEEFKEWKVSHNNSKEIRNSVSAILWSLIVIAYFVISFVFGIWYISWIIFLIGALLESIISLLFKLGEK